MSKEQVCLFRFIVEQLVRRGLHPLAAEAEALKLVKGL